jgi:hypothetical protein
MFLVFMIAVVLVLSASAYAFVGRSTRRHHPDIFRDRSAGRSVQVYPNWRPTDRYR